MRRESGRIAANLAMLGMLVACTNSRASCAPQDSRAPDTTERTYIPVSRFFETWGLLQYSSRRARLVAFA